MPYLFLRPMRIGQPQWDKRRERKAMWRHTLTRQQQLTVSSNCGRETHRVTGHWLGVLSLSLLLQLAPHTVSCLPVVSPVRRRDRDTPPAGSYTTQRPSPWQNRFSTADVRCHRHRGTFTCRTACNMQAVIDALKHCRHASFWLYSHTHWLKPVSNERVKALVDGNYNGQCVNSLAVC